MSDMAGAKALALDAWCRDEGRAFLRFDYAGHGRSAGRMLDGTIGGWLADALAMLDNIATGPQIVVGSSMGGWLALLLARARPGRVCGLLLLAAAPDFTEKLMWPGLTPSEKQIIEQQGVLYQPSAYGGDYIITRQLIEEGRRHNLLDNPIDIACPVRLLHGMADADVPWQHALRIVDALKGRDVTITLVKAGDHRLSTPADLGEICRMAGELCKLQPRA